MLTQNSIVEWSVVLPDFVKTLHLIERYLEHLLEVALIHVAQVNILQWISLLFDIYLRSQLPLQIVEHLDPPFDPLTHYVHGLV